RQVVREVEKEEPIFAKHDPDYLLALGVPVEWLDAVRLVGEEGLTKLLGHLPEEAAERLFDLASGVTVPRPVAPRGVSTLAHPDAQRRIRTIEGRSELERALEFPLDEWMIFLHPLQQTAVEMRANGPALVTGGAGTGKTVVALHRAAYLARRNPRSRIL